PSQYPDLVEGATFDGRPLRVDSEIPVTATVTLQVGSAPEPVDTFDEEETESTEPDTAEPDNSIFD
ncbi:MAG: hypothetical protein K2L99_06830, partial [Muribaculaceae bacterium]|nr:hypothetical protein [Muribaculaceae bacterium]